MHQNVALGQAGHSGKFRGRHTRHLHAKRVQRNKLIIQSSFESEVAEKLRRMDVLLLLDFLQWRPGGSARPSSGPNRIMS
eukprot:COSAG05_NODE_1481_length_4761_cov_4.755684_1_plen_80_part_00